MFTMQYLQIIESALLKAKHAFKEIKYHENFKKKLTRGYGEDITIFFDKHIEEKIIEYLKPYVSKIISEEIGILEFKKNNLIALIDPVDGSTNTFHEIPFCATSIAFFKGEKFKDIIASGIVDLVRENIYLCDGKKVYLNKREVSPSKKTHLNETIASMDMRLTEINEKTLRIMSKLLKEIRYVRFLGAMSLELAFVSSGNLDAFIVPFKRIRFIDIAAGIFMVKTVGGYVEILEEKLDEINIFEKKRYAFIAVANKILAEKIKKLLKL